MKGVMLYTLRGSEKVILTDSDTLLLAIGVEFEFKIIIQ